MSWLSNKARPNLVLGTHAPHFSFNTVSLNPAAQRYHGLIVGKSGSGKSKLLQHLMLARINNSLRESPWTSNYSGHGATVLEPHHDLSFDILTSLVAAGFYERPDAYQRVVYLDFGNDWYVPFNVLAGDGDSHERASMVLDAMYRIFPEVEWAPTFTRLLLASVVVLIENELPITYLAKLFSDTSFRRHCLEAIAHDQIVLDAFAHYEQLGRDQAQEAGSTINRAFQIAFNSATRLSLGQPENALPFRQWMDEGRFIILNIGRVKDGLSRKILGAMLMVTLEQAAKSRMDMLTRDRVQHTLMVDEWPAFAATAGTFEDMLSQARKFGLNVLLSCQSLAQIDKQRLSGAFENCKLGIFFALGQGSAELSSRQIGDLDPFTIKEATGAGDSHSPTEHDQYMPLLDQVQLWTNQLKGLSPRHCYVKVDTAKPRLIRTPMIREPKVDQQELQDVLATYRQLYQRSRQDAEQAVQSFGIGSISQRDDVAESPFPTALDWDNEAA
jgi:hypothetical protein